jgi:hypothetical protein
MMRGKFLSYGLAVLTADDQWQVVSNDSRLCIGVSQHTGAYTGISYAPSELRAGAGEMVTQSPSTLEAVARRSTLQTKNHTKNLQHIKLR